MEPTTPDSIEPPANVLLVHTGCREPEACQQLRRVDADAQRAELRVSFSSEPSEGVGESSLERPSKLGLVSIGDVLRSSSAAGPDFSAPVVVDTIDEPDDLAAIGLSVSRFCERWGAREERLTVCFRSLDALLRHAPPKQVFQFAHVLTNRLSSVDAYAHFHFDPTTHDDRTIATFGSIFDEVVCDDSARGSMPEATDEDVAAVLAEWTDDDVVDPQYPSSEATDEEIAQLLSN